MWWAGESNKPATADPMPVAGPAWYGTVKDADVLGQCCREHLCLIEREIDVEAGARWVPDLKPLAEIHIDLDKALLAETVFLAKAASDGRCIVPSLMMPVLLLGVLDRRRPTW
jgi:hypothetical protein